MGKLSPEEIRKEVFDEDAKKDVSIYLSVPIGVVAGLASAGGFRFHSYKEASIRFLHSLNGALCAVIMMRALVYFREGVDAYWLTCVPFMFPVITGLFAAYKKQFGHLGVHLMVTLLALLMGGLGFGTSVEPIFINRHDCVPVSKGMPCDKASLSYMYLVSGSLAAGFSLLGFFITLCSLYSSTKRINERERQAELKHLQEVEAHQRELRQMKAHEELKPRTLSMTSQHSAKHPPTTSTAANGIAQTKTQAPSEHITKATSNPEGENVTTKL